MGIIAKLQTRWMKSVLALSLALPLQAGFLAGMPAALAEGPADPAPYIEAKVVNENAGKKVLFDNTHAQTAGAADWVIDGGFSDFGHALAANGYYVKELRKAAPFTYDDLKRYDVFVIAEPNIPFKQSEQAAMEQYVQEGGAIFFIGDHYNADRNKNRWDGSEAINGYRRGAWENPAKGMSAEEASSAAMQGVVSSDWLGSKFGVRFRYNALGDITANQIVAPGQAFGITAGVSGVAMHAGSTLAITDPTKAKGIVYLPQTQAAWPNAVDQGVYNGGGLAEGPYVAVSKAGKGKAAFIGDSSPVEDATPKYLREETGARKTTYDGFKEQDDAVLLVNIVNWLSTKESYTNLAQVDGLQLDQPTALLPFEAPEASTEPQAEPWSAPAAGYKWWDRATFKPGSYGATGTNATYSFVHQAQLPNAQEFQLRVVVDRLPAHTTVSGFSAGIYLTGGTQVALFQNADGTWPTSYNYSSAFSLTSDSQGRAYKDLTVRIKPGTSGSANLRLRQNGTNLLTSTVTLANVPAEPLPDEEGPIPAKITVAEARGQAEGKVVTVEGVVTTEPGAFGGQAFYLQDATGGIYVFQSQSGFHQGDVVKITAPLAVYNTELELIEPVAIEKTGTAPLPAPVQAATVDASNQGQLVELSNVKIGPIVSAAPAGSFEFDAVQGETSSHVRVDVRTGLQQSGFPYQEGQTVTVRGIASIFKGVYQLKPRGLSDFTAQADTAAPVTTASLSESPNASGWFNRSVTVTLTAAEEESLPVSTYYSLNGEPAVSYTAPFSIEAEGTHTIQYYSADSAGNQEAVKTETVKLDKTPPSVTLTQSGKPVGDVKSTETVRFDLVSSDAWSGVAEQKLLLDGQEISSGASRPAQELGLGTHTVQYRVTDAAGNVAEKSYAFKVTQPSSAGAPGKPVLSDDNGQDGLRDGSYIITMNMWWGNNGSEFRLYENGTLIGTSRLTEAAPAAQAAKSAVTGRVNGTYTYTCELINDSGSTACEPHTVTVTDASPAKPVLSQDNWDGDGSYRVTMNMWWGTNGSEYRLYENGELIDTKALQAASPGAQQAATDLTGRAPGQYEYRAELVNSSGRTWSETIVVKVVK
ncbi:HYR domain-containing protein [Paenibacillus sp. UNCCL117]|uniref:OmpL47-type beta-barrel domain-containing protein n=1 Tax=unclassified Paenibacillus TaxID=185978 RepID=UPI0008829271|nr:MULTISPECIES: HYR domain-containing protein [unclassified Paenibacillus]SDD69795.1 HYR domain-containing protein [Paenibacillus sp. cl123]SFW45210.1 HYR domain-containing protein [Paenibacillus sp. UNCCL117]